MKPEELMLGDIVLASGKPIHVTLATLSCKVDVKPMPLTEDILRKNGFEKCGNHSWHDEILRQIYVRIVCLPEKDRNLHSSIWRFDFPCVVSAGADDVFFRCDYVHELQHVLKLCGIEKEVVV